MPGTYIIYYFDIFFLSCTCGWVNDYLRLNVCGSYGPAGVMSKFGVVHWPARVES